MFGPPPGPQRQCPPSFVSAPCVNSENARFAPRRPLRIAYRDLWSQLDTQSGAASYAAVASITAEGAGIVAWRDVAPFGHRLIEQYLWADRLDGWSAMRTYEDALWLLQESYDAKNIIPGCSSDAWLYWLGHVDGPRAVRNRLRHLGLLRIPHYATLAKTVKSR